MDFTASTEWEDYLRKLSRTGAWADEVAIRATAMVFDRPIYVISSLESENSDKSIDALSDEGNQLPPFLVGHLAEHHYWSLDVNYAEQCSLPRSPANQKLVPTTTFLLLHKSRTQNMQFRKLILNWYSNCIFAFSNSTVFSFNILDSQFTGNTKQCPITCTCTAV